jgi:pyruvate kinase
MTKPSASSFDRRAKIICTIGPASSSRETMCELLESGMDVARFNFSHGGPEKQSANIEQLRALSREMKLPVALLQDLQGPKIRTGPVAEKEVELHIGQRFILTTRDVEGNAQEVTTTYHALPSDCCEGDSILLDDGLIALCVDEVTDTDVICTVTDGGTLKANKGINLPGVKVSSPALTEKDRADAIWGIANGMDFIALSFVRQADEVRELKQMVRDRGGRSLIIAKLEKPEAIENLDEILHEADGVMVARGDLGVEMDAAKVPLLQKHIIKRANEMNKIVITATQMLESMTNTQRPTRAEASDVANAVLDGTDALMLSGETAAGSYPVDSLQMMANIIHEVEKSTDDGWTGTRRHKRRQIGDFPLAICEAAAHAAAALGARVIVCFSQSGETARLLSKSRPPVPVVAFTPEESVVRQLKLAWGVRPYQVAHSETNEAMVVHADYLLVQSNEAQDGDMIVVTMGSPVSQHGSTNAVMELHRIGGSGQGRHSSAGSWWEGHGNGAGTINCT